MSQSKSSLPDAARSRSPEAEDADALLLPRRPLVFPPGYYDLYGITPPKSAPRSLLTPGLMEYYGLTDRPAPDAADAATGAPRQSTGDGEHPAHPAETAGDAEGAVQVGEAGESAAAPADKDDAISLHSAAAESAAPVASEAASPTTSAQSPSNSPAKAEGRQDGTPPANAGPDTLIAAGNAVATMVAAADQAAQKKDLTAPTAATTAAPAENDGDLIAASDLPLGPAAKTPDKARSTEPAKTGSTADKAAVTRPAGSTKPGSDEYIGAAAGQGRDRWTSYNDPMLGRTYGWDVGGNDRVKHAGGQVSAAVTAVSKVEGSYDSVQTYDRAVLTFGILQWTVHAGGLQAFLGYLKDEAGPQAHAAFAEHLGSHGIDIKKQGGQYALYYQGKMHKGAEDFDALIRSSKETARQWVDWFHALGRDPRAQKAEFDYAKLQFAKVQQTNLTDHVVQDALKRTPKTFHAKNKGNYGSVSDWTSQSPKAAVLYFSMHDNNPAYANAALLKAIDAFYAAHGSDRTKWPKTWPDQFADVFAAKCRETLSSWGDHKNKKNQLVEGRVSKTLRYWSEAEQTGAGYPEGVPGSARPKQPPKSTATARPSAAPVNPIGTPVGHPAGGAAPIATPKPKPGIIERAERYASALAQQVKTGVLDAGTAVLHFMGWANRDDHHVPAQVVAKHAEALKHTTPATPSNAATAAGHAAPLATAGAAFHDGSADKALGAGDEVFKNVRGVDRVVQAFPSTPEGLVAAALYELHRGDKRSLAAVMNDHSSKRWERGKDAALESDGQGGFSNGKTGINDDGKVSDDENSHVRAIGHLTDKHHLKANASTGPIQAYKTAAQMGTFSTGTAAMWCGAFVTYCLARCGIDAGSLAYAPTVGSKIAKAGGQSFHFDTTVIKVGNGADRHKNHYRYGGNYYVGKMGDGKEHNASKTEIRSGKEIDIRPGDVFYSQSHTGLIVGVNKQDHQIVLRTVEGNSTDQVRSLTRVIQIDKDGHVKSANFEGWGRPAAFGPFAAPPNDDWITAPGGRHRHDDEGKTT